MPTNHKKGNVYTDGTRKVKITGYTDKSMQRVKYVAVAENGDEGKAGEMDIARFRTTFPEGGEAKKGAKKATAKAGK